jgi:precorrin-4 methylase
MGMTHLEEIMRLFSTHKPKNYPVAVVQSGTLPTERWVLGTIENIAKKVSDAGINNPATIFVGPAVTDSTTRWQLQREVQLA